MGHATRTLCCGLLMASLAGAVTCASGLTHIVDRALLADQSDFVGRIYIKGPVAPLGISIDVVPASFTVSVPASVAGAVDFCLAGGPGWKYEVVYQRVDSQGRTIGQEATAWWVPRTANILTLPMLAGSELMRGVISPQQMSAAGLGVGQLWLWSGTAWVAGSPGTGGGGGGAGTWGGSSVTWGGR